MRPALAGLMLLAVVACGDGRHTEPTNDPNASSQPMPLPRGGAELIGHSLAELKFDAWIGEPLPLAREHGATLVRWWTDGCPFCEASLPAVDELRREFEGRGLVVIAAYHNKSAIALTPLEIEEGARARGYDGRIALDRDWHALDVAWPAKWRSATSVTLLLDAHGVVRFAHPGPEFHRSTDAAHAECASDFADLERAVALVLAEDACATAGR